ncbi:MAG: hypothetical protein ACFCUU_10370 [Cyclobacteriaceae bacterium]
MLPIKKAHLLMAILSMGILFISCDVKDKLDVDPLVGEYVISEAKLTSALSVGQISLPEDYVITTYIRLALYSSSPCELETNLRIQLAAGIIKTSGDVNYVCEGEDLSEDHGTWIVNSSRTDLDFLLNLDISPLPVPFKLEGLSETSNSFTGNVTDLPVPTSLFDEEADPTDITTISFSVTFTKV